MESVSNSLKEKSTKNHSLDFIKGIGCIGVVIAHAKFPGDFGIALGYLAGFYVVPLFFMISGYYSGYTDRKTVNSSLPRKIKHILLLSCISFAAYFLFCFIGFYFEGGKQEMIQWLNQTLTFKCLVNFIVFNDLDFIKAGQLWFLFTLLYCYLLLYVINRFNLYKIVYYSIPLLLICRILITYFSRDNWHLESNILFSGLPFFMLGNLLKRKKDYIHKLSNKALLLLMTGTGIFAILPTWIDLKINIFYMGTMLFAVLIFIYAQNNPQIFRGKIEEFGRKYSLFIYIIHVMCIYIINIISNALKVSDNSLFIYSKPILVVTMACLSAYVFYYIKDKLVWKNKSLPASPNLNS